MNKSRSGRPDCRSNITDVDKSKKRPAQPSKFDLPNKRSKKEESQVPYGKKCSGGRKAKKNRSHLNKSVGHSSSVCIDNMDKNHATLQKNSHIAHLNKGPSSTGGYAQFEGRCRKSKMAIARYSTSWRATAQPATQLYVRLCPPT